MDTYLPLNLTIRTAPCHLVIHARQAHLDTIVFALLLLLDIALLDSSPPQSVLTLTFAFEHTPDTESLLQLFSTLPAGIILRTSVLFMRPSAILLFFRLDAPVKAQRHANLSVFRDPQFWSKDNDNKVSSSLLSLSHSDLLDDDEEHRPTPICSTSPISPQENISTSLATRVFPLTRSSRQVCRRSSTTICGWLRSMIAWRNPSIAPDAADHAFCEVVLVRVTYLCRISSSLKEAGKNGRRKQSMCWPRHRPDERRQIKGLVNVAVAAVSANVLRHACWARSAGMVIPTFSFFFFLPRRFLFDLSLLFRRVCPLFPFSKISGIWFLPSMKDSDTTCSSLCPLCHSLCAFCRQTNQYHTVFLRLSSFHDQFLRQISEVNRPHLVDLPS